VSARLTWLADALRAEGCKVEEISGWKDAGRPGDFDPDGPLMHHTGSTTSSSNTHPTLNTCINGRSDLEGPLCQVMIGYDGICYVIAAGRANHGGACSGWGPYTSSRDANDQLVGIEIDYDGTQSMSAAQKDAGTRVASAILKRFGHDEAWAATHKETSTTGKWDTGGLTGDQWRDLIKDRLEGKDEGLFGMTTLDSFSYAVEQKFKGNGEWKTVGIGADGAVSLVIAPKTLYHVELGVTLRRANDADAVEGGDTVHLRLQTVDDYSGDKATVVVGSYPIHEVIVTAGDSFANLSWLNSLGDSSDTKATRKLRLFILPPSGASVLVSKVLARVAY
jgi:hypothetical protein